MWPKQTAFIYFSASAGTRLLPRGRGDCSSKSASVWDRLAVPLRLMNAKDASHQIINKPTNSIDFMAQRHWHCGIRQAALGTVTFTVQRLRHRLWSSTRPPHLARSHFRLIYLHPSSARMNVAHCDKSLGLDTRCGWWLIHGCPIAEPLQPLTESYLTVW